MLSYDDVEKEFEFAKKFAHNSLKAGRASAASRAIALAANLAYHFMMRFKDSELEELVSTLSTLTLEKRVCTPKNRRVVFFDVFGFPQRGLTQQYLRALNDLGVEVLYIYDAIDGLPLNKVLSREIATFKKMRIVTSDTKADFTTRLEKLADEITDWSPCAAFLHLAPWSVGALALWQSIDGPRKLLVDITDHAFWLGTSAVDEVVEFSNYGMAVARGFREIEGERLHLLPYYPILDDQVPFQGWPDACDGRIVIFTGGSMYKMLGENEEFFQVVKRVVTERSDCVVCVATSGNDKPLQEFVAKHRLRTRVFALGNRKDFAAAVRNCDIYLDTYPISGGLAVQFAIQMQKPVIWVRSADILSWSAQKYLLGRPEAEVERDGTEEFLVRLNRLIETIRSGRVAEVPPAEVVLSPARFAERLGEILAQADIQRTWREVNVRQIDMRRVREHYLMLENRYLRELPYLKFKYLRGKYFVLAPVRATIDAFGVLAFRKKRVAQKMRMWVARFRDRAITSTS